MDYCVLRAAKGEHGGCGNMLVVKEMSATEPGGYAGDCSGGCVSGSVWVAHNALSCSGLLRAPCRQRGARRVWYVPGSQGDVCHEPLR